MTQLLFAVEMNSTGLLIGIGLIVFEFLYWLIKNGKNK